MNSFTTTFRMSLSLRVALRAGIIIATYAPPMPADALTVVVRRGDVVEAVHRVHVVASDEVHGNAALVCLLRSSAKPIQAIPLVEAYDDLDDDELAIGRASCRER